MISLESAWNAREEDAVENFLGPAPDVRQGRSCSEGTFRLQINPYYILVENQPSFFFVLFCF